MDRDIDLIEIIQHIPPAQLSYQEWVNVGMALKLEGYPCTVWDTWSRNDSRYKTGVCEKKWESFNGNTDPVTGGTLIQMAKDFGYSYLDDVKTFDWDDEIGVDRFDVGWIEPEPIDTNTDGYEKKAVNDIITYIDTLFKDDDHVGYVTKSYKDDDGKLKPADKGSSSRTAKDLIAALKSAQKKHKDNPFEVVGDALGDYDPEAGAWIRFNPLDGKGIKNENVTEFRFALVESDSLDIEQQYGVIKELQLPVAILVHSGGKSLHAIVRVDAPTKDIYKERVEKLYKICDSYGLRVDTQNKNPSRLSRLPGIKRGNKWQKIIAVNIGLSSWKEWEDHQRELMDNLPDPEDLFSKENEATQLRPEVISGVLRKGRKMILTGASKAGKSFLLVELAMALATGSNWIGFGCQKCKVLYINFEIPKDSFTDRLRAVSKARGIKMSDCSGMFDCLSLRGYAKPFRELLPSIKHKVRKGGYEVVIIDPIYKTLLGDENDARVVAEFCNALDNLATDTDATVIFCHHHSKGAGEGMAAQNRASGSGVFARDPDAILDLLEISPTDRDGDVLEITEVVGGDLEAVKENEDAFFMRLESSLREFKPIRPLEIVFHYPAHYIVKGLESARGGSERSRRDKQAAGRATQQGIKEDRKIKLMEFIDSQTSLNGIGPTLKEAVEYFENAKGFSEPNIKKWLNEDDRIGIKNGILYVNDD